jgi:hypothetical protein
VNVYGYKSTVSLNGSGLVYDKECQQACLLATGVAQPHSRYLPHPHHRADNGVGNATPTSWELL